MQEVHYYYKYLKLAEKRFHKCKSLPSSSRRFHNLKRINLLQKEKKSVNNNRVWTAGQTEPKH